MNIRSQYKILFTTILFACTICSVQSENIYLSTDGNNDQSGLTPGNALATLSKAMDLVQAGDTIFLLPGIYRGRNYILEKSGLPDQPITIRSFSNDPFEFAVIDGESEPSSTAQREGIVLQRCSWINIENLVFQRCWVYVIHVIQSSYISVRSCHFTTGKRVIHAVGLDTHHLIVENCYVRHPDAVWKGWSWESLHHGEVSYYNGGLLHPNESAGGHVMRGCTIINMFNAFRTRPSTIKEDGNTEVYNNTLINIRDNDFEPEGWAWNVHYYYNKHINIHKIYSIDDVKGGNIYIYGNTYTQTRDPWAIEEVSGIFKYKNGHLTYPCYAFNNSYYTEAKVLRDGESTNYHLKHFNNAYFFFQGSNRFQVSEWQPGYEFNNDCINQDWPKIIYEKNQEENGLKHSDPQFEDGLNGDFRLRPQSPCIDQGKTLHLPEFQWTQSYSGQAPDIGAYEGSTLTDGPPFRFIPSPEGAHYQERPRITRHKVKDNLLYLYFSEALDATSLTEAGVMLFQAGEPVTVERVFFPNHTYEAVLETQSTLHDSLISILFKDKPTGLNGLAMTYWASTIPIGRHPHSLPDISQIDAQATRVDIPDFPGITLQVVPNPMKDSSLAILSLPNPLPQEFINHLSIYSIDGDELYSIYDGHYEPDGVKYEIKNVELFPGVYIAKVRVGKQIINTRFVVIN